VRPLICYEDLFGEDFADSLVGPQSPTVLANASNLAWFGRWMMQDQHQFSRMRAMEFQRPLVLHQHRGHRGHRPPWRGHRPPARLDARAAGRGSEGARASRPTPPGWRWHLLPLWLAGAGLPLADALAASSKPPTQP
jgi:apolipoprotein N-acyltransferase